jgi:hypothetical protein
MIMRPMKNFSTASSWVVAPAESPEGGGELESTASEVLVFFVVVCAAGNFQDCAAIPPPRDGAALEADDQGDGDNNEAENDESSVFADIFNHEASAAGSVRAGVKSVIRRASMVILAGFREIPLRRCRIQLAGGGK